MRPDKATEAVHRLDRAVRKITVLHLIGRLDDETYHRMRGELLVMIEELESRLNAEQSAGGNEQ